ncbi:Hypothetical predicted protein [Mytilus galloprovincialis]|uniref:Uncharacterized protein n=1 Tax=Mytilus galloprovincialis TaxID=29158 RepID=A0A8B6FGS1_MYTGA|nr:Hypothetical predicted protein [Mytilus galloprovincialis]
MVSSSHEIDIAFDAKKNIRIDLFGQLSETVKPCQVQYKSKKFQQAQIITEKIKHIVKFEKDTEVKLKAGDCKDYETEIILSSNPYGVVVLPGTERAVVTLPAEESIQFINTANMTKDDKVKVGFTCFSITAGRDRIYVGGMNGTIKVLDINGTFLHIIKQGSGVIFFLVYDDCHAQFFVRSPNKLQCFKLDGTLVYSKDVSGTAGVTRDRQGNIYCGGYRTSNIQRMSSDGENCEEMLKEDDGIDRPYGMCFNNDFTKLFVINNSQNVSVCIQLKILIVYYWCCETIKLYIDYSKDDYKYDLLYFIFSSYRKISY